MYKIEIKWDFRSPTLGVLVGDVQVGMISLGSLSEQDATPFRVKKQQGILEYKDCPSIFARCKPLVDVMVNSYYDGMLMNPESFTWFRDCSRSNNDVFITMMD